MLAYPPDLSRRRRGPVYPPASGGNSPIYQALAWFCELDESSGLAVDSKNGASLTAVNAPGTNATGSPFGGRCRELAANTYFVDSALDFDRDWTLFGMIYSEPPTVSVSIQASGNWGFLEHFLGNVFFTATSSGETTRLPIADNTWYWYALTRNAATGLMGLSLNGGAFETVTKAGSGLKTLNLGNLPGYGSTSKRLFRTALSYHEFDADDVATAYNGGVPLTLAEWAAL